MNADVASTPKIDLSEDKKTLLVEFGPGAEKHEFDVAQVDALLMQMAIARSHMHEPHPISFSAGQKFFSIPYPSWSCELEVMSRDVAFHFRHPGYGWLHFLIARADAAKMGTGIQDLLRLHPTLTPIGLKN